MRRWLGAGLVALAAAAPVALRAQAVKQPVYVGRRACAQCHEGRAAGSQYSHGSRPRTRRPGPRSRRRRRRPWPASAASPTSPRGRRSASAATRPRPTPSVGEGRRVPPRGRCPVREVPRAGQRVMDEAVMRDPRPRAAPGCAGSRSATARSALRQGLARRGPPQAGARRGRAWRCSPTPSAGRGAAATRPPRQGDSRPGPK